MKITRREFLKQGSLAAGTAVSGALLNPSYADSAKHGSVEPSRRVLVVINLIGGNDGLNTVIPLNQYERYRQLRPKVAVAQAEILSIPGVSELGLHPRLLALRDLYSSGKVAIINAVGEPETAPGLFDHQAAQNEFQTCDVTGQYSGKPPSGWLGRFLDRVGEAQITPGVDMGGGRLILLGEKSAPLTITTFDAFGLDLQFDAKERRRLYRNIQQIRTPTVPVAEVNRQLRLQSLVESDIIRKRTSKYTAMATYPATELGGQLLRCAQLIWADLGVRAISVGYGDFDTHFGQVGRHDQLLEDLSNSVVAFYNDLNAHGLSDRVLILTISEFGRRPYENSDVGTDHGYASVAFAIGDPVKGGIYRGYPSLDQSKLVLYGNMDVNTDFRSVYTTAAASFLDVDPVPVVGGKFPNLGFL